MGKDKVPMETVCTQHPCSAIGVWKWNSPGGFIHGLFAFSSQITHTVAAYMQFERVSVAQRWITFILRKDVELRKTRESTFLCAKNGRFQMMESIPYTIITYTYNTYTVFGNQTSGFWTPVAAARSNYFRWRGIPSKRCRACSAWCLQKSLYVFRWLGGIQYHTNMYSMYST